MDQFPSQPPSDDDAHGYGPERQKERDSLFLMSELRLDGATDSTQVRVRNLSPGGLMAEYPPGLDTGQSVECEIRGIGWVPGKVAWAAAGRIGIAFDRPIDPLLARKPVGAAKPMVQLKPLSRPL